MCFCNSGKEALEYPYTFDEDVSIPEGFTGDYVLRAAIPYLVGVSRRLIGLRPMFLQRAATDQSNRHLVLSTTPSTAPTSSSPRCDLGRNAAVVLWTGKWTGIDVRDDGR